MSVFITVVGIFFIGVLIGCVGVAMTFSGWCSLQEEIRKIAKEEITKANETADL